MPHTLLTACVLPVLVVGTTAAAPSGLPDQVVPLPFGVNIHFTDPKPGEMEQLAAGGFRFVRMDFVWEAVERQKGLYDFSAYDRLLSALDKHGIRALFIFDYSNKLYEADRSVRTPEGRRAFAAFAEAAAKRYAGRGVLWEIWNEPNLEIFWRPQPAVDDYAALVIETAKAIRKADPKATVLAPASSGFPWEFLEGIFRRGVLEVIDAVSVHPYRAQAPETALAEYARLRELIAKYAPSGKRIPIVSGEWGYSLVHHGGIPFSAERQAQYLVRQWLVNMLNGVLLSIWYDWHDDGPDPKETEHNFGTVTFDYKPKPSYIAAQTLTSQLSGYRLRKRLDVGSDADYVLVFTKGRDVKLAVWTTSDPHTVRIPAPQDSVAVVSMLGQRWQISAQGDGRERYIELELTQSPSYVFLPGTARRKPFAD
ncbi:MAG: cellulase family glycosylhydrolase [Armatimonadota bacterium]